ncbi:MAG: cadherin-like domain-containing protein, partial [Thiobacillus sp.]
NLTIDPVTDLTAIDDSFSVNEDTLLGDSVATNDSTTSGGALTYALTTGVSNGSLILNADGTFTYTGNANFNGTDSFTYTVTDAASGESDVRTVSLTIDPVNDAPTITANTLSIIEGAAVVLDSANLNASDLEQGPAQLTYTVSNVFNGQFEWAATPGTSIASFTQADIDAGRVVFVHDASDVAPSYNITVSDGTLSQGPQAASISFTSVDEGINVSPASGASTTEGGGAVTFDVTLNSQPFADVTLVIVSSNAAEGTASVSLLTFTAADWNVAQQVTVTGVNDFVDDGDQAYSIQLQPATSADRNYNALDAADIALTNLDDDTAGIVVTPMTGLVTDEAGGSDTFSVVLTSQPMADVVIGLSSSNPAEGVLSAGNLVFTPGNWNIPKVVVVTGVNDALNDGDVMYQVIAAPAASADPLYNGMAAGAVDVTNLDVADPVIANPLPGDLAPALVVEAAAPESPEEPLAEPVRAADPAAGMLLGEPPASDNAVADAVDGALKSAPKTRAALIDTATPNHREVWTDPEIQGGPLLHLLNLIQVDHMADPGHNLIAPAIHIDITEGDHFQVDVLTRGTQIAAISLSVGAVWWALRAGGLFASLLTSLPAWRAFDVLPVLARDKDEDDDDDAWAFDPPPDETDPDAAKRAQDEEQPA